MRKIYRWATLLSLAALLTGCSAARTSRPGATDDKPRVVATTSILCDLTQQLAEDSIELICLLEAGQDPHTYRPTPRDRKNLEDADLVLYSGYNFAPDIIQMVDATRNNAAPKIAVYEAAVAKPILVEAHEHEHGHKDHEDDHKDDHEDEHGHKDREDDHHNKENDHRDRQNQESHKNGEKHEDEGLVADPHIWHDVESGIQIVSVIDRQLQQIAPDHAKRYQQNAKTLTAELQHLDTWVQAQVATVPAAARKLITTHDAFRYYARAYGFSVAGALSGLSTEERPSAGRVGELVDLVETAEVPAIFAESTTNRQLIETVARDANVKVAEQPLFVEGPGSDRDTYQTMIVVNTCTIVVALGGTCSPWNSP